MPWGNCIMAGARWLCDYIVTKLMHYYMVGLHHYFTSKRISAVDRLSVPDPFTAVAVGGVLTGMDRWVGAGIGMI